MTSRPIVIVGAGGHGQVVADAAQAAGLTVLGFADPMATGEVAGLPVLGDDEALDPAAGYDLANGLGGTGARIGRHLRRAVQERLEGRGFRFVGVRHPAAVVSSTAMLAEDVQVMALAVVQTGAVVGRGVIVNTAAVVEHGCRVGPFTHCASGAILCGDVDIGEDSHVGAGAVVRQSIALEAGVVVGAGAVVTDRGEGVGPLLGVPAKRRGMA